MVGGCFYFEVELFDETLTYCEHRVWCRKVCSECGRRSLSSARRLEGNYYQPVDNNLEGDLV